MTYYEGQAQSRIQAGDHKSELVELYLRCVNQKAALTLSIGF